MDEGFVHSRDIRLAFRDSQTPGRDVVLIHGVFANLEYFSELADRLSETYRVVSYDLRGHGRSGTGPMSLTDNGDDLVAVIEELELARPFVIGASYGGWVALEVAARAPQTIDGIIIIDGPITDRGDAAEWSPAHPSFAERRAQFRESIASRPDQWQGSHEDMAARLSEVAHNKRAFEARRYVEVGQGSYVEQPDADTATDLVLSGHAPVEHLFSALSVPALVLVGSESGVIYGDVAERQAAAKQLSNAYPRVEVRTVDGGHDLVGERLDAVDEILKSWLPG